MLYWALLSSTWLYWARLYSTRSVCLSLPYLFLIFLSLSLFLALSIYLYLSLSLALCLWFVLLCCPPIKILFFNYYTIIILPRQSEWIHTINFTSLPSSWVILPPNPPSLSHSPPLPSLTHTQTHQKYETDNTTIIHYICALTFQQYTFLLSISSLHQHIQYILFGELIC